MMPDKVYVVPMKTSENQDAFVGLAYELDKLLIDKTEYIRKDALLEWLKEKVEWYEGTALERAYLKVIDKINKM